MHSTHAPGRPGLPASYRQSGRQQPSPMLRRYRYGLIVGRTRLVASRGLTEGHPNQLPVTLFAQQVNDPLKQSLVFHCVRLTSAVLNCAFALFPAWR